MSGSASGLTLCSPIPLILPSHLIRQLLVEEEDGGLLGGKAANKVGVATPKANNVAFRVQELLGNQVVGIVGDNIAKLLEPTTIAKPFNRNLASRDVLDKTKP